MRPQNNYPAAYCVKCKTRTSTQGKHTVVLKNNTRAITGVCPECESQVFRIMPRNAGKDLSSFREKMLESQTISRKTHFAPSDQEQHKKSAPRKSKTSARKANKEKLDYGLLMACVIAFLTGIMVMSTLR